LKTWASVFNHEMVQFITTSGTKENPSQIKSELNANNLWWNENTPRGTIPYYYVDINVVG
jgi:hypothetical protein